MDIIVVRVPMEGSNRVVEDLKSRGMKFVGITRNVDHGECDLRFCGKLDQASGYDATKFEFK